MVRAFVKKTQKTPPAAHLPFGEQRRSDDNSIRKAQARLNSGVRVELDALAPEFEISAELARARVRAALSQAEACTHEHQPVHDRPTGERPDTAFAASRR